MADLAQGEDQRDDGIEMGAGDRTEDGDEHDQDGAGRDGVAEERDGDVPAGQPLGHDAGTDDGGKQQRGAQRFGAKPARQYDGRHRTASPCCRCRFSRFCSARRSRDANGRLMKMLMRLFSIR